MGRNAVLWVGPAPSIETQKEYDQRELRVMAVAPTEVRGRLPIARALVVHHDPAAPDLAVRYLEADGAAALDHGLGIWALAEEDAGGSDFLARSRRLPAHIRNAVVPRVGLPAYRTAEEIARHDPGPPEKAGLNIAWDRTISPSEVEEVLLRRAFGDCESIAVDPLDAGQSARVYRVQAVLYESRAGRRPLPFFAKFDSGYKIKQERANYRDFVDGFIPYRLHTNVIVERTLLGGARGILVTNFVEGSVSLWEAAQRGDGPASIHSLFQEALYAWRREAYIPSGIGVSGLRRQSLLVGFEGDLKRDVPDGHAQIARQNGLKATPEEIRNRLASLPLVDHRVAPMHGDLHVRNVRVRNREATVIDFNSTRIGPLLADPASLDVSLGFESFGDPDNVTDQHGWQSFVDELYSKSCLHKCPPMLQQPGTSRDWLLQCIRQTRAEAFMGDGAPSQEYATMVAFYLFRLATFGPKDADDKFRRAYALVLADQLLR
jgi:hypothetical protein